MKKRNEISNDELMYRQLLKESLHIKPSRKAVQILEDRITKVLVKLGVDVTKNKESVDMQMSLLGIDINSISEEQMKSAAGLYISVTRNGEPIPYAYISGAKLADGRYTFPIMYWENNILDEGVPETI